MMGNTREFPPVVTGLIAASALMFLFQQQSPWDALYRFALWPLGTADVPTPRYLPGVPPFYPWQLVTYAFLHGSFFHILVNMFALWIFGAQLENRWGSGRFAFYYFFCAVGAGLVQLAVVSMAAAGGDIRPTVGASGGVLGVLMAFAILYPNQQIMLLIPPVPMKAKWFVVVFGAISLLAGVTGTLGGIAHFAHLGGMVFGLILMLYWRSRYGRGEFF